MVTRVIDGDTFIIQTGQKIRLIGIDAPEMNESKKLHFDSQRTGESIQYIKLKGRKSFEFMKNLIEGEIIRLEFEDEKFDKYGRLLAYAWLQDGTFINATIIQDGYATPIRRLKDLKHYDLFQNLYFDAKENKAGLWEYEQEVW